MLFSSEMLVKGVVRLPQEMAIKVNICIVTKMNKIEILLRLRFFVANNKIPKMFKGEYARDHRKKSIQDITVFDK